MKLSTKLTVALSAMLTTTLLLSTTSVENPRCEKKIDNIQEQIQRAKKTDNSQRINGLEISLSKVKAYCTDEDLIQDIKDKISDVTEKWNEYSSDFSFKVMNMPIKGNLFVENSIVKLDAQIPFAAVPFKRMIETTIRNEAEKLLK